MESSISTTYLKAKALEELLDHREPAIIAYVVYIDIHLLLG